MLSSIRLNNIRTKRGGIIPYTVLEVNKRKVVYFLMAIDFETREYSDFGGGVMNTETALDGAIREFKEESQGIFEEESNDSCLQFYNKDKFLNSPSFLLGDMCMLFHPVKDEWLCKAREKFQERIKKIEKKDIEIMDVSWLEQRDFVKVLKHHNNRKMWKKIKDFLNKNIDNPDIFVKGLLEHYRFDS